MTLMAQDGAARVIAQQWISLDGYAAGHDEDAIFSAVPAEADLRSQRYNEALLNDVDQVMLGRRTYEMFREYWPTASEPITAGINGIPKVVASRTQAAAPWGAFAPATVCRDAVEFVRQCGGGTLLVWGSIDLVHTLLTAGLLDELDLFVSPIWLGAGRPLLPAGSTVGLRQSASEDWGGVTHLRYTVER
ncbi:dihydrofolate reductase family protein [Microterricola viridarii]|uniref:Dihydrofolate reductase n=1 Tax=Microterricola viridarii TaxID=412690 RepID=A0A1H1VNX1_9MICO|nr:dihydrofolate reductase family protein [Microterricola viridarii]SDS85976.1 Dihydrofolate reductase [Microterricola viridarii]